MYFGNLSRETYGVLMSKLGRDAEVDEAARVVDRVAGTRVVSSSSEKVGGERE